MHTPDSTTPTATPPPGQTSYGAPIAQAPTPSSGKKSRWWIWLIVVLLILGMLGTCCVGSVAMLAPSSAADFYSNGVAVIHVDGIIAGTSSSGGLTGGGEITPEYLIDILHAADDDPGIEAIVLRIDSPGGTVAASQEVAMEIARIRKPVIASIGDVAASGAYWIASQCDVIVATPTSAVGSIGVILQIPNYEGLLEKIGVEYTIMTRGEFKDSGSPYRSITATEMAMLDEDLDFVYQEFINGVAEGRELEVSEVEEMATGWVWSAAIGQEMGLVDVLGTYQDALDVAADEAGLSDYEVIYYDQASPWDVLYWLLSATSEFGRLGETRLENADLPPVPR